MLFAAVVVVVVEQAHGGFGENCGGEGMEDS